MNIEHEKKLILAIETAVGGGSISILDGKIEIDHLIGAAEVSRGEDVLEGISEILKKNGTNRKQIKLIAVSVGAGSATGLKIGLATAKGLARGFACRVAEISLWDALAQFIAEDLPKNVDSSDNHIGPQAVYLPGGKKNVCRRYLKDGNFSDSEIVFLDSVQFSAEIDSPDLPNMYVHRQLISESMQKNRLKNLGDNLSAYIGKYASDNENGIYS